MPKAEVRRKSLRMSRTPKVALLLETSTEYGRGLLRGIIRYAKLHGPWSIYMSPGHLFPVLPKAKSWDGNGIIARVRSTAMAKAIRATGVPVVASSFEELDTSEPIGGFCEIRTDSPAITRLAARHLLECGLENFAFCGFRACRWSTAREDAFREILAKAGFTCTRRHIKLPNLIRESEWIEAYEHEQPALARWLLSLPKPVGLMACNDICGRQVLQACAVAQLRVPDDVAVVGVDNDELICDVSDPPLSSVGLNLDQAGYGAAAALDALMSKKGKAGSIVLVGPTSVTARRSSEVILQDDAVVGAALRFIRDHARQPIGVPDVIEELKVSRRTLERRFRSAVGYSVASEITRRRMERARRLLTETDSPVYRVANSSGFRSVITFNRLFRRIEKQTPRSFRRQMALTTARTRQVGQSKNHSTHL
jgi:LacI family transcriptional regulator